MLPPLQGRRAPKGQPELLKVYRTAAVQCLSVVGVYIVAQMKGSQRFWRLANFH